MRIAIFLLCLGLAFQAHAKLVIAFSAKEGPALLRFEKGVGIFYRGKKILEHDEELFQKVWDFQFTCERDRGFKENVESVLNQRKEAKDIFKDW